MSFATFFGAAPELQLLPLGHEVGLDLEKGLHVVDVPNGNRDSDRHCNCDGYGHRNCNRDCNRDADGNRDRHRN